RLRPALMKKSDRCIKYEKQPNNRGLDIFSEDQLQNDGDFEQDRHRRQEFAQHQPQRMNGDIGCCIRTEMVEPAAAFFAGKPYWLLVQMDALPVCDGRADDWRVYKLNCVLAGRLESGCCI